MSIFGKKKKKEEELQKQQNEALNAAPIKPIDPREECLKDTRLKLSKLKMFCSFFNNELLNQIYEQSEFIYNVFDKNKDLNYRKLDQYSYYYTDNLIILLDKLKKGREDNIIILLERLDMNTKKLNTNRPIQIDKKRLENEKKKWASFIGLELARTYRELSGFEKFSGKMPVKQELEFITKFPDANYFNISKQVFDPLTDYKPEDYYNSPTYYVHRKLMGKLNKALFAITYEFAFTCGEGMFFYLFKIKDTSDLFIFIPHKMAFKLIQSTDIVPHQDEKISKWGKMELETQLALEKIEKDKLKLDDQKKIIEPEILDTLQNYLNKINEAELLSSLNEVDIDRRTLEEILKLQRFEI